MALFHCLKKIAYRTGGRIRRRRKKRRKKEETIPDWIKISARSFKRIRERVKNYVNNG